MNTRTAIPAGEQHAESPLIMTEVATLEKDVRWLQATDAQRVVLKRIAAQRDRLAAARRAQVQARALSMSAQAVPADAPLPERLAAFARLHPVATAAVAAVALLMGPRKLVRYAGLVLPLLSRFKR